MKAKFDLTGRDVILTFGLLSPNKGIEHVIEGLPQIVAAHPGTIYCIAGATHEKEIEHNGEAYREYLTALAQKLGVADNLRWINRYLPTGELLDLIEAADIYVTPYPHAEQASSGTLAYAVALGKAVVSTPYSHACELLGNGVGQLVPFNDGNAIADHVTRLLTDRGRRAAMQKRAYGVGREMIWQRFGERCRDIINAEYARARSTPSRVITSQLGLLRMCDDTGILQHGVLAIPDRAHGYCIDDNARALMLAATIGGEFGARTETFAAFVQHGWNPELQRFRNFMGYDRRWLESEGSEDSCGRALWALGVVAANATDRRIQEWASALWTRSAACADEFEALRALSFAALGADALLEHDRSNATARTICEKALAVLDARLDQFSGPQWYWFEPKISYDNCRLPQAMLACAHRCGDDGAALRAVAALEWIVEQQTAPAGHFRSVGSNNFGCTGPPSDPFDQQAIDAWATVDAACFAHRHTGNIAWANAAETAFAWFFGANDRGICIADPAEGSCFDGLTPSGANRNLGAESVLSLHLAQQSIQEMRQRLAGVAITSDKREIDHSSAAADDAILA